MRVLNRWSAVVLGAVAAGVLLFPSVAQAAPGSDIGVVVGPTDTSRGLPPGITSTLPFPFSAGDCTQLGGGSPAFQSEVRLDKPDASGRSRFTWDAFTYTRHTNNADIWHGTFRFRTAFGTPVLTVGPFDSVPMRATFHTYTTERSTPVTIDPALFDAITQVDWLGDC
ncbi:hypothetical protein [Nonomuraea sediminis]|uniref:hypothetical protein n=1 Tax=Nonomuraea sediminis TaxID=2835864 RepID=UPI001BDD2FBB|nr:hypothetical protein [Nonomuraea sediminis]